MDNNIKKEYSRAYYIANKERINERNRAYAARNRETIREYNREYYAQNREKRKVAAKNWLARNPHKQKERIKKWICDNKEKSDNNRKVMNNIKIFYSCSNPCCEWNGQFQPQQLDFHHIDPKTKKFNVGQQVIRSISSLSAEINKCCVLCRNCHSYIEHTKCDCSDLARCNLDNELRVITVV